ncbi:phosphatase PAP2 family protein [Candidatus Caldatribacterium sp. SIUC1]|uniref:phosphatase PAP2 family protein n=1 Tax=Candidatus Caldatribacterium sp. SIUC1 TaxID=3418365 RepID=UPI003F68E3D0
MDFFQSIELLLAIQRISSPFLDLFMRGISFLGSEFFYFGVLVFLYWRTQRAFAIRLAFVVLVSLYTNFLLKALFALPRPAGAGLRILEIPEDFSFPSGHAQSVASFWFFLAFSLRRPLYFWLSGILTSCVALSRMYLGVHYPGDVVSGASLGVLFAWFFTRVSLPTLHPRAAGILLVLGSLAGFLLAPTPPAVKVAGSLSGALSGYFFATLLGLKERPFALREYLWGAGMVLAVYLGGKMVPLNSTLWLFGRYFLANCCATFFVPLLVESMRKEGAKR